VPLNGEYHQRVVELIDEGARDHEIPQPSDVRVIVKLNDAKSEGDVSAFNRRAKLTGVVINRIEGLGDEAKKILRESYPAVDLGRCWIFHEGRTPTSGMTIFAMLAGAFVTAVICVWPFLARIWRDDVPAAGAYSEMPIRHEIYPQRPPTREPGTSGGAPATARERARARTRFTGGTS
jgi:hypothetical protein